MFSHGRCIERRPGRPAHRRLFFRQPFVGTPISVADTARAGANASARGPQPQVMFGQPMAGPPTSVAGTALAGVNASAHCPIYAGGNVSAHGPHSGPYLLLGLFLPGVASPPYQHACVPVQGAGYQTDPLNQGPFLRASLDNAAYTVVGNQQQYPQGVQYLPVVPQQTCLLFPNRVLFPTTLTTGPSSLFKLPRV